MNISFHKFFLTPLRPPNARENLSEREGVFLMGEKNGAISFWEYFPHPELGDDPVDKFLESFKEAKSPAQKKAHLRLTWPLKNDSFFKFKNHELFIQGTIPQATILKYKLLHKSDLAFIPLIQAGHSIRLDANGIFSAEDWPFFEKVITPEFLPFIEYIEDPLNRADWSIVNLPKAQDFISGHPYQVKVYKPYRELFPSQAAHVIFSAPMGHLLGNYLTYQELIEYGDLELCHGLITPCLYQQVPELFTGNYKEGFQLCKDVLESFLSDLKDKKWESLCTI